MFVFFSRSEAIDIPKNKQCLQIVKLYVKLNHEKTSRETEPKPDPNMQKGAPT